MRKIPGLRYELAALLLAATLPGPLFAGTKTSDLVTCTVVASSDTFELNRGFPQLPEYARFGLIFCEPRPGVKDDVTLELSSHGSLAVGFFDVPKGPAANLSGEPLDNPPLLAKRLGLPEEGDWNQILQELRATGRLRPVATGQIAHDGELWLGYVATMQADRPVKTESDIMYSANAMETEKLLSVPVEPSLGVGGKLADAFPTFVTNLLGVLVGAGLSYFFFHRQQRVLGKLDELKLFRQRKLERAEELLRFFREDYQPNWRTDSDDPKEVRKIRRVLIEKGIYSMLPLDVMDELNAICDGKRNFLPTRGKKADDLLRKNFRELMVDS